MRSEALALMFPLRCQKRSHLPHAVDAPQEGLRSFVISAMTMPRHGHPQGLVKGGVALKTIIIEMKRDVEQCPYTAKPLLRHYRSVQKKSKDLELMKVLDFKKGD
jgi:hypothetical protein